jgi:hypothetical protein
MAGDLDPLPRREIAVEGAALFLKVLPGGLEQGILRISLLRQFGHAPLQFCHGKFEFKGLDAHGMK